MLKEIKCRKLKYILFAFIVPLFFAGVFLISPSSVKASSDHIVINEIYPAPDTGCDSVAIPNCNKEWVELFNPTDSSVNLSNYALKDGSGSTKNLSDVIVSSGYYVYENSSGWLNNSGEAVILVDKFLSETIDQVAYGDWNDNQDNQPPVPTTGKSLSRIPNGVDSDNDKSDFRIATMTKNAENILPVYPNSIKVNEIMPQPADGSANEFIELYNSGIVEVDLSGWQIDDIDGGSSPFTIPDGTKILANYYLVFYNSQTKISLNDSGDSARIFDPNGDLKDQISYTKANRGQSFSRFDSGWQWTLALTPGSQNILELEFPSPAELTEDLAIISILEARGKPIGEIVKTRGTVTVVPGILSDQYFYIQDENSGIQIYFYSKTFPNLQVGDVIEVVGEISEYKNEKRLKISAAEDIIIISTRPPPEPLPQTIEKLNEEFEGRYVKVFGTVSKTSGNTFYLHGSGEIQIVIRGSSGIKKPKMRVGDKVEISGILSQYGDYYRILPIKQDDVKIIQSGLPDSGPNIFISLFSALIMIIGLWILSQKAPSKRKLWQKNF